MYIIQQVKMGSYNIKKECPQQIQYRSEISGLRTHHFRANACRKTCKNARLRAFHARFLLLFTLITVLCVAFFTTKQTKRQFPQTPLKGYLRRQSNSRYVFPLLCFSIGLYNHITERMKNKFEFSYIWFYKS